MYNGIIYSIDPPAHVTGYAWVKELEDGSQEWYRFDKDLQQWVLDRTEPAYATLNHSHPTHGDINFTGTISANGQAGITGTKVTPIGTLTFTKGLLTGFTPA